MMTMDMTGPSLRVKAQKHGQSAIALCMLINGPKSMSCVGRGTCSSDKRP